MAGRVLVKFRAEVAISQAHAALAAQQGLCVGEIPEIGVHIVDLAPDVNEAAAVEALRQQPDVEFAELDRVAAPAGITPNDPDYPYQWALPDISLPNAWLTTTGSSSVVIAILDTGVTAVADLPATKFVAGCDTYDDPNCLNPSTTISDVNQHGTETATAAAAVGNNGIGVASPCWGCSVMPVRITDTNGNASVSAAASGLTWAANHGAKVAYVGFALDSSPTVLSAAEYFFNNAGVVVMPVGNGGFYETNASSPYVLVVSGVDSNNALDLNSDYGYDIDLTAPFTDMAESNNGNYIQGNGTSFSSALVAGVAGLVVTEHPCLSGAQVKSILEQTATPLGGTVPNAYYGYGLVNASAAVSSAATTACTSTTQPPVIISSLTASGMVNTAFSYQITASNSPTTYSATGLPSGLPVNATTGLISGTPLLSGSYNITISATNSGGTGAAGLALTIKEPAPAITSSLTASGTVNTAFSYQITASNSPTSYNATGLPSGLSVNTSTGVISGTTSVSGSFSVTISATNPSKLRLVKSHPNVAKSATLGWGTRQYGCISVLLRTENRELITE